LVLFEVTYIWGKVKKSQKRGGSNNCWDGSGGPPEGSGKKKNPNEKVTKNHLPKRISKRPLRGDACKTKPSL